MKIVISFLCTDFEKLKKHWSENSASKLHTGTNVGMNNIKPNSEGIEPFLGGKVIILDWEKKKITWDMDIDGAAGFFIKEGTLYINNMRLHYISVIDINRKKEINRVKNHAFNCLHSLEKTENGYLLSSTGTDLVIEVNSDGKALFEWWAVDNGFDKLPNGNVRTLLKNINHNKYVYPTLSQTTHINSATNYDNKFILSTLFHQGQLIKIDRYTKKYDVLLSGLSCPHGVKRYKLGWVISNTKKNELILLDENFKSVKVIDGDYDWIQDNCPIYNNNILIADANHNKIIEVNPKTKAIEGKYEFPKSWRIYQINSLEE